MGLSLIFVSRKILLLKEETIGHTKAPNAWAARADCENRSKDALEEHAVFFENPNHVDKVNKVTEIVLSFFTSNKGVYVNRRVGYNHADPHTTIKVDRPIFPQTMSTKDKEELYKKPLESLGVTVKFNKGTISYIYSIR